MAVHNRIWDIVFAPFQWIIQMPFALPLGLLFFGLTMLCFTKRNQKGLVVSVSVSVTALLAVAWGNSRVPLTAPLFAALRKMPLRGIVPVIIVSAAGFGVLTALAVSFTQIKLNRYIALASGYDRYTFVPHINEEKVRLRCGLGALFYWMVETGMLLGLSRCPHAFRLELPYAFAQPPFRFILQGRVSAVVIVAAIAVAGAGGVVAALFRLCLRKKPPRVSVKIYLLRMIVYLGMMAFASVSGAVYLAVAYAVSLGLSARFVRLGYCRPEDCVPRFWFALEERHCLLCGFMEGDIIRSQKRTLVNREEIRMLKCVHTLSEQRDSRFLHSGLSRDALWHIRLREGDAIAVCADCRKVFFAEDFTDSCPLCASRDKLWFSHPAALLLYSKTTLPTGVTIERPYKTSVLHCEDDRLRYLPDSSSCTARYAWLLLPAAMYVAVLMTCG